MRNNSNSRGGRRPQSAERKRTPFRRPGEGNLPRTRRVREDAPFSERAGLASPREAFGQMESEADGYRGFADRPIALDIIDRARQQQTPADLPTEKLQKALADAGLGSRRDMEALIASGVVTVNGQTATVGDRVTAADMIRVEGRLVRRTMAASSTPRVLMYHKMAGEIVSRDDPEGRPSVFARLPRVSAPAGWPWAVLTSIPRAFFSSRPPARLPTALCIPVTRSIASMPFESSASLRPSRCFSFSRALSLRTAWRSSTSSRIKAERA